MKKFLALYLTPVSVLEGWMNTPEAERKVAEEKMQKEWGEWMAQHGHMVKETVGAGKTKRVTKDGVIDVKNDVMLYSIIEAGSHEEAAKIFEGHPHLGIPEATIDVMTANPLPGMENM